MADFLEKFLLALVSGVLVPILLEMWKARKSKKAATARKSKQAATARKSKPAATVVQPPTNEAQTREAPISAEPKAKLRSIAWRLFVTAVVAFFGSAIAAAFIDSSQKTDIQLGSGAANVLMVLCGLVAWLFLSRRR